MQIPLGFCQWHIIPVSCAQSYQLWLRFRGSRVQWRAGKDLEKWYWLHYTDSVLMWTGHPTSILSFLICTRERMKVLQMFVKLTLALRSIQSWVRTCFKYMLVNNLHFPEVPCWAHFVSLNDCTLPVHEPPQAPSCALDTRPSFNSCAESWMFCRVGTDAFQNQSFFLGVSAFVPSRDRN